MIDVKLAPIACAKCRGEGSIEIDVTRPHAWSLDVRQVTCSRCQGTRVEACVSCGLSATLAGEDGRLYCGVAHAVEDGNWPTCRLSLGLDACDQPQDPSSAPYCCAAHESAALGAYAAQARAL